MPGTVMIKNVLDVKDDNPLPKGSSPQSQFNRSILVLTPQRALKFTAMSVDRHFVWLTALSFLSHSTLGMDELAIIPPMVPQGDRDERPDSPVSAPGTRKGNVIRKPKSKQSKLSFASKKSKSSQDDFAAAPAPSVNNELDTLDDNHLNVDYVDNNNNNRDDNDDDGAASPPTVPMTKHRHARKRSNTAPRLGAGSSNVTGFSATGSNASPRPRAVRNFSSFGPSTMSTTSGGSGSPSFVGSIDAFYPPPPIPTSPVPMSPVNFSRRPSEASRTSRRPSETMTVSRRPSEATSLRPSDVSRSSSRAAGSGSGGNTLTSSYSYTDSVGTARMEAFIAGAGAGAGASSTTSSRRPSSSMRGGHYRKTSSVSAAGTAVSGGGTSAQPEDFIVGFENFSETASDPFRNF